MSENIEKLRNLLSCDVLPISQDTDSEELMNTYLSLWEQGKTEKFVPIIVVSDETFLEKIELDLEDEDLPLTAEGMKIYRENILAKAKELDKKDFYTEEKSELRSEIDETQISWEYPENEPLLFVSCFEVDYEEDTHTVKEDLCIVKIPTDKPYETFAWLPFGGFNGCPSPAEMVAVAKYWYENHGAEPAAISYDEAEFYLQNPIKDKQKLIDLAIEQYVFDVDIVEQGVGDVESLIETLYNSKQWYFWWD